MDKQCDGCVYYKSLGDCGDGTEKACHYLLICGEMRKRDGRGCRSRQEKQKCGQRMSGKNLRASPSM